MLNDLSLAILFIINYLQTLYDVVDGLKWDACENPSPPDGLKIDNSFVLFNSTANCSLIEQTTVVQVR